MNYIKKELSQISNDYENDIKILKVLAEDGEDDHGKIPSFGIYNLIEEICKKVYNHLLQNYQLMREKI